MTDYLDNKSVGDEELNVIHCNGSVTFPIDDQDSPLLNGPEQKVDQQSAMKKRCLFGQEGFAQFTKEDSNKRAEKQIIAATGLCFIFMIAELIGGYVAGSLAIMTDGAHLFSDLISFIVSLLTIWLARKPVDHKMSFGYKRLEVVGAILSVFLIWLLTAFLIYFAILRIMYNDFDIDADVMMIVSSIGVVVNIIMVGILHGTCFGTHMHSHSHKPKGKTRESSCKLIGDNQMDEIDTQLMGPISTTAAATFIMNHANGNGNVLHRNNSICSYRSPNSSRNNSISLGNGKKLTHQQGINGASYNIKMKPTPRSSIESDIIGVPIEPRTATTHTFYTDDDDAERLIHLPANGGGGCHSHDNINLRAAVIHVIGDFVQSIGVFIAAVIIKFYPNAKFADPICTFIFSIIVILTTLKIFRESVSVLLDSVPHDISINLLESELKSIGGVLNVHHLNVWSLSVNWHIMSVHLIVDQNCDTQTILELATLIAKEGFHIRHCTIQIELQDVPCTEFTQILNENIPLSGTPLII